MLDLATRRKMSGAAPSLPLTAVLTGGAFFMVVLDGLVVITALPSIHRELGGTVTSLQWTVNAYNMAFAAGMIAAAALGDRFGRRRVYLMGLVVTSAASAGCALAPSAGFLIAARTVQGLGAAVITPLSLTILTAAFPPERRGAMIGIWSGVAGLGAISGPLVGGAVTQGLSWHWIFWVNVPVGILASIGSRFVLPESHGPRSSLDVPGLVLAAAASVALVWGLVQASQDGWTSPAIVAGLVAGGCLLALFLAWEARADEPMIPLSMFRNPTFSAAVVALFSTTTSTFGAVFLTSQFFQLALGASPLATGLRLLPWTATPCLSPVVGRLSDRIGCRALMGPGIALQAIGYGWIAVVARPDAGYGAYVLPFLLAGVGIAMVVPTASAAALDAVPPEQLGNASGISNTLQRWGAVFGVAVATAVFDARGSLARPDTVANGYRPGLAVAAGIAVIGIVAALAVRRREPAAARTIPSSSASRTAADDQ